MGPGERGGEGEESRLCGSRAFQRRDAPLLQTVHSLGLKPPAPHGALRCKELLIKRRERGDVEQLGQHHRPLEPKRSEADSNVTQQENHGPLVACACAEACSATARDTGTYMDTTCRKSTPMPNAPRLTPCRRASPRSTITVAGKGDSNTEGQPDRVCQTGVPGGCLPSHARAALPMATLYTTINM